MQDHQGHVYHGSGEYRLRNAHGDGLFAHMLELLQAEFVADGEGNEAQGGLGDDVQGGHLFRRMEPDAQQVQPADAVGPQQQPGHQIGRHRREIQLLGQTGHQEPAHQGEGQGDQNLHGIT